MQNEGRKGEAISRQCAENRPTKNPFGFGRGAGQG
jgi:hypothetical protein